MQAFRQLRHLTRFVLVWFALSLGVAMASSLVAPKATELVCTSGGMLKLVAVDGNDSAVPSHVTMDCALYSATCSTFSPLPRPAACCSGAYCVGYRAAAAFSRTSRTLNLD